MGNQPSDFGGVIQAFPHVLGNRFQHYLFSQVVAGGVCHAIFDSPFDFREPMEIVSFPIGYS